VLAGLVALVGVVGLREFVEDEEEDVVDEAGE